MSADTCAALAQILPVFLIALVAERVRWPRTRTTDTTSRRVAIALSVGFRALTDIVLAFALVADELSCVLGIQAGGLTGRSATLNWAWFFVIVLWTLLRWLLYNPIVLAAYRGYWRLAGWAAEALFKAATGLGEAMARVVPGVSRVVEAMTSGLTVLVEWLARLPRQ